MEIRGVKLFRSKANASSPISLRPLPLIEVVGTRRVLVENHLGVISYSLNSILVKVCNGTIEVLGDKLEILCMSRDRIVICGSISSVQLRGYDQE